MFFDLDGTLHQQDMFGSFLRYLLRHLPLNLLLVVPMGPVILAGLAVSGRAARWPMSLLLWATTFGRREAVLKRLEAEFVGWFRHHVTAFPVVHARLTAYLTSTDADVWLITGSPQSLVEQVYRDTLWLPRVNLIASRTARRCGCTAAIATASRTTRCSAFASIAGGSLRRESCSSRSNSV